MAHVPPLRRPAACRGGAQGECLLGALGALRGETEHRPAPFALEGGRSGSPCIAQAPLSTIGAMTCARAASHSSFSRLPQRPSTGCVAWAASALPPMTRTKQALLRKRHGGEAPRKQMAPKAARKSGTPFHRTRPDPVPCSLCAEPGVSLRAGTWVCAKHSRAAETAEWQRREAKRKRAADAAAEAAAAEDAAHDARIDAAEAESSESEGGAILLADGVVHSVARKALRLQHALSHAKPEAVVAHLLAVANGADAAAQHALAKMLPKAAFPAVRLSAVTAPRSAGAHALTRAACGHRRRRHTSARAAAKSTTRATHTGAALSTSSITTTLSCAKIAGTMRATGAARGAASASTAARGARTSLACALKATTRRRSKGARRGCVLRRSRAVADACARCWAVCSSDEDEEDDDDE